MKPIIIVSKDINYLNRLLARRHIEMDEMAVGKRKTIRTRYGPFTEEVLDEVEIVHHPPQERVKFKIQRKKVIFSEKDPIHKGLIADDRIDLEYIGAKRRPWVLIPEKEFAELIGKAIEKGVLSEEFVERLKPYLK